MTLTLVTNAQHSVARKWNEVLLEAIRNDLARPTVHARNLFHISAAMYDSWAIYDQTASTYFLNNQLADCPCTLESQPSDPALLREEALSYAAYRLIMHRFESSPGASETFVLVNDLMNDLGYSPDIESTNFEEGAAQLGNYIADCIIEFGLNDGSNEINDYANLYYRPVNRSIDPRFPGTDLLYPNNWQPITFNLFVDQSGNIFNEITTEFLSPEWGEVTPFAMDQSDMKVLLKGDQEFRIYHDPGPPPYLDRNNSPGSQAYKWGFTLVSIWQSHHDPSDGVLWDISPASIGNLPSLPESFEEYPEFYNLINGGDNSLGRSLNPVTGEPYTPQIVPRSDYTRVLAEFWADGPDSETPPGHWYTILNYVTDQQGFERKFEGDGEEMDPLEWDVKSYFTLGGAMHDAAISAWSVKGWYDYVRPISALRYMAGMGQASDAALPNYNPFGIVLQEGYVELVFPGDPLAGANGEHINKIKLNTWRGPDFIDNPDSTIAGVGWILAENWWPYQRPTFVSPPFAGYVSGHSTYSRAAAEVLTAFTGSEYFPGGMGEFVAKKDAFLVFEDGPSQDITLQWATYRDASDQCSLSRIWGGIHPPADDIPGRKMGIVIGLDAFDLAKKYFEGQVLNVLSLDKKSQISLYPNPVQSGKVLHLMIPELGNEISVQLMDLNGKTHYQTGTIQNSGSMELNIPTVPSGVYVLRVSGLDGVRSRLVYVSD